MIGIIDGQLCIIEKVHISQEFDKVDYKFTITGKVKPKFQKLDYMIEVVVVGAFDPYDDTAFCQNMVYTDNKWLLIDGIASIATNRTELSTGDVIRTYVTIHASTIEHRDHL